MALYQISLIILVIACIVRGQVNQLSTDFKPPPPPPPQPAPVQSSAKLPFSLPPLLSPSSNHISSPANNNIPSTFQSSFSQPYQSKLPSQPPQQSPVQFSSQQTPQPFSQHLPQHPPQHPLQHSPQHPPQHSPQHPPQQSPQLSFQHTPQYPLHLPPQPSPQHTPQLPLYYSSEHLPSQFSPQYPPPYSPQLPTQFHPQSPIQLPHPLQQQVSFQLPPFPIQPTPSFLPHYSSNLQTNSLSSISPSHIPQALNLKALPPSPLQTQPRTKLHQFPKAPEQHQFPNPPEQHQFSKLPEPPFPLFYLQSGTKNISLDGNRSPRTLQMIGSNNPHTLQKMSDNLRPNTQAWFYKKNALPKRSPYQQASIIPMTTTTPLTNTPQPIPLNQLNHFEPTIKHNQQGQSTNQAPINHYPTALTNNQYPSNSYGGLWNNIPPFHPGSSNTLNNFYHSNQAHPSSNFNNVDSLPKLKIHKSNPTTNQASSLHINVGSDTPSLSGGHGQQAQPYHPPSYNLHQAPLFRPHTQQSPPYNSHQQSSPFHLSAPHHPITPLEVFQDPSLHIAPISIPPPESPHFETLRSQVSALKAKHKSFFSDHKSGDPSTSNVAPHPSQTAHSPVAKPAYGTPPHPTPPSPPPPTPQVAHTPGLQNYAVQWNPNEQNKLAPPKWHFQKHEFENSNSFGKTPEQFNGPKKPHNDFVGFPPAKGSINNELNFISNWEKGIGIIHKTDHGNAEKGQTIVSPGVTDEFKKIDKQESSKVEVFTTDGVPPRRFAEKGEVKKQTGVLKKNFGRGKPPGIEKKGWEDKRQYETTTLVQELSSIDGGQAISNATQKTEAIYRRKRDVFQFEDSTTEGIDVDNSENESTEAPIVELETEEQLPYAESLVASVTESTESTTQSDLPHAEPLVAVRKVEDLLDSSEEDALLLDSDEGLYSHAADRRSLDLESGETSSEEQEAEEARFADMTDDDYDDAYTDEELSKESHVDTSMFEEFDGTTSRPEAMPIISKRMDISAMVHQLVDPRGLHGAELIAFLDEALRNSSRFLPDEAEDRSFDIVEPPNDIVKFPYYDRKEPPINVDSALRFAENLTTFSKGLFDSKYGDQCPEVDIEIADEPTDPGRHTFNPVRRLKRLGNKIDCLKNRNFGKDPLNNPLFKEEFVGGGRASQPDPSVAVFSDVIRLIKQHLDEEEREKAKDFNDIVSPRQLNLSDTKTSTSNNAVLEQLKLGRRRPLLPKKQHKKVEEPKQENTQTTTNESHGLKIVFPRRLNITKYDEAKKATLLKSKTVDLEAYKAKLNQSRLSDHDIYKVSLARKINFDKLNRTKTPKSQRRASDDRFTYEAIPRSNPSSMQIFDINSFFPKAVAQVSDDEPAKKEKFESKYDQLEREANELIDAVQKSNDEVDRRLASKAKEDAKDSKDKPYGTSYSPSYRQYRLLSRKDDQKRTPTVDELVNFYSKRSNSDEQILTTTISPNLPSISLPSMKLKVFDVSTFYPRRFRSPANF
ncbi:uncharacterized protein LOC134218511 isoform X2 [Armigeres subalbatus]|uniref:uncharacterized protein LOC134218511 isoform X2 n=1 Tax=Armigeres subalbatus TaxID=124917 RepID=UPI002ED168B7